MYYQIYHFLEQKVLKRKIQYSKNQELELAENICAVFLILIFFLHRHNIYILLPAITPTTRYLQKVQFFPKSPFCQKLNITTLYSENWTFFKIHEIEYTSSTMFKKTLYWWNWISSFPYMWGKTPIWIERNLISIPPKRLGVLAGIIVQYFYELFCWHFAYLLSTTKPDINIYHKISLPYHRVFSITKILSATEIRNSCSIISARGAMKSLPLLPLYQYENFTFFYFYISYHYNIHVSYI